MALHPGLQAAAPSQSSVSMAYKEFDEQGRMRQALLMLAKECAKLLGMKKLLLIVLLVLVPFQISWAMAGDYCQHENGPVAAHFGHHAHHHQSKADQPDSKNTAKLNKMHSDCGSCHTSLLALLLELDGSPSLSLSLAKLPQLPPDLYTSHIPDGPHEPDRAHSA